MSFNRDTLYHQWPEENSKWTEEMLTDRFMRELNFHSIARNAGIPVLPIKDVDMVRRQIAIEWHEDFLMQGINGNGYDSVLPDWKAPFAKIEIGTGRKMKDGDTIAVLSIGHPGNFATQAIRNLKTYGINAAHYDMRFVKPLDEKMLHEVFSKYSKVITVEDGTTIGGFGSAILEFMAAHQYHAEVRMLGIPDRLVEHGTLKQLHRECGYDAQGIEETAREMMEVSLTINN